MRDKIIVLKFGSSVLRATEDLPNAVHEIYRWYRDGHLVIAVVSAIGDTTNELQGVGRELSADPEPYALAELLATGERQSAALLGLALDRVGVPARVVDPRDIGLLTIGTVLDSEPVGVNRERILEFFSNCPVLVVPGFFGFDEKQRLHLLGRGGSDLTAVFLSSAIGGPRCRLLKDVDGVYESDPACAVGSRPRRFASLSYAQALEFAGPLIQPKAVAFLARHQRTAEVAALARAYESHVGYSTTTLSEAIAAPPTRVLLLGLGTVGAGVYRRLAAMPEQFQVVGALVRSDVRHRAQSIPEALLQTDAAQVQRLGSDVVVDALPGVEPSSQLVTALVIGGIDVVTANKALIAHAGIRLAALATQHGVSLRYSAAAGGSAPMIETVSRLAKSGEIASLTAILNGTCNFVLEQCEQGVPLDEAVRDAQQRGYAELDADEDLSGRDAARKLRILARHAWGREIGALTVDGIKDDLGTTLTAKAGGTQRLRLIGTAQLTDGHVHARVQLEWIGEDHPLANIGGEWNALAVTLVSGATTVVTGRGAGRWPTTEAVIADLLDLRRERHTRGRTESGERAT